MTPTARDARSLARDLTSGSRRALAQAITLVEGTLANQCELAQDLIERVLPSTGNALRVGFSGTPGVGKSTLIEAMGIRRCEHGNRLAVLAVDPSSPVSGGSVLGDKTRMEALGRCPDAFIRPSPSRGALGGVARRTREALLLCEAAGFDIVFVETVGVGQSEVDVASMVDTFVLLLQPASGDQLQGIKRGILELADVLVVTKADNDLLASARETQRRYEQALPLLRPGTESWRPPVVLCSSKYDQGLDELWDSIESHRLHLTGTGRLQAKRAIQAERWLRAAFLDGIDREMAEDPRLSGALADAKEEVRRGRKGPTRAAKELVDVLFSFQRDRTAP